MKYLLASTALAGAMLFASNVAATDFDMFVCQNCSFDEARDFAIQKGEPEITCQPSSGVVRGSLDEQQCFSPATDYLVVDEATKALYAFRLTHTNQGGTPDSMHVEASAFTPSPELHSLAINTVALYEHRFDTLDEVANSMSRTFNSPEELQDYLSFPKSHASNQRPSTLNSSCESDPSYLATHRTFGVRFEQDLRLAVSDLYRQSLSAGATQSEFFDEFTVAQLPVLNAHGGVRELNDSGHWEYQKEARRIVHQVQKDDDANIVTIDMEHDDTSFIIRTPVNHQLSTIDGIRVADLTPENATSSSLHVVNECVTEAFSEMFASVVTDMDGAVISSFGWNPNRSAGEGGVPAPGTGSSWTTQSPDLCRAHFYRHYERTFGFVIPCP